MKKVILCLGITVFMSVPSFGEEAVYCASGAGQLVVAHNGDKYCVSSRLMNWWSAFSWCESVGGKLISSEECVCNGANCPQDADCNNFKGLFSSSFWTSTTLKGFSTYCYSTGGTLNHELHCQKSYTNAAVCKVN